MAEIGKYIYVIVPRRKLSRAKSRDSGRVNSTLHLSTAESFSEEYGANGVYTISYQDISAVVSESEIIDCTYMHKDALARLLVKHQKVIEGIMSLGYTIIPMRLGTFAVDENEAKEILKKGYSLVKDIIKKINDKIEIDVAATWRDFASILKEIGEEEKIKEFKERLLANPNGITVDDQMKVGFMVRNQLEKKGEKYALEIQTSLSKVSDDIKIHALMDDKMITNIALLIYKTRQKDFDKKVEQLNAEFNEKLNFRCVGPLPPYSFYTLEIKKMQFEEIDWARKKLGLNDFTTKSEIKKTYQRLALSTHPDKNPNKPGIDKEFDDVTHAFKVLWEYCLSAEQTGQNEICSFNEHDFKKNSMLVRVRE